MPNADPVPILQALIRCPSVTPDASAALDTVEALLAPAGFSCERLEFGAEGRPPIDNLFARIGDAPPHLCLAGHVDVVPPGDAARWSLPPFAGEIRDGCVYGRGAEDMKGGLAAALAASLDFVAAGMPVPGSLSFLVTGDEEGEAVDGTARVLDWMAGHGHLPDHCLLGEPTNREALGDTVKVGRRGSLTGTLAVTGFQGHVAYPDLAANPIPALIELIAAISGPIDNGTRHFAPSHLEVTTIDVGNPATNVIPAFARAVFNVRFNDRWSAASLEARLRERLGAVAPGDGISWTLEVASNAEAFVTEPGPFLAMVEDAAERLTGRRPELSTGGGTSDARFIARYCPVVEFGLVGRTMHQVDEHTPIDELEQLTGIYHTVLKSYFGR